MIARILRERVLTTPHDVREIPPARRDEVRAERTLFGWVLRAKRTEVLCRDEAEARYLAAFARMGYTRAPVPEDPGVVQAVLRDVEKAVADIRAQVQEKTCGVFSESRRAELEELVWEALRDRIGKISGFMAEEDGEGMEPERGSEETEERPATEDGEREGGQGGARSASSEAKTGEHG